MEQKRIEIELRTVSDRNGNREMTIVNQSGDYMRKNEIEIITFIENREDIGKIRNYLTRQKHKVTIRRSGAISMSHHFEVGKKSESLSRHPYGALHFLITTKSLDCTPLSRSEEHTSELQSRENLVCRLLLEKKNNTPPTCNNRLT